MFMNLLMWFSIDKPSVLFLYLPSAILWIDLTSFFFSFPEALV